MVWFLGTGGAIGWPNTTFTTSTLPGWASTATTTSTTASSIMYVTMSQTGTGSTMGLYNSPTWIDQWSPPIQGLRQPRIDPQIERAVNAQQEAARMAAPAVHRRPDPAARRARELLLSYLSDDQRRTFEEHGWFVVLGGRSGRRYRISGASYAGNVALLHHDNDNVEARFCGHCDPSIPLGDQLLAQKVMLEVDEPAYIALANRRAA